MKKKTKLIHQKPEEAGSDRNAAQKRKLRKKSVRDFERVRQEALTKKTKVRAKRSLLRFEQEDIASAPTDASRKYSRRESHARKNPNPTLIVKDTATHVVHREMAKQEDDNSAIEGFHATSATAENAGRHLLSYFARRKALSQKSKTANVTHESVRGDRLKFTSSPNARSRRVSRRERGIASESFEKGGTKKSHLQQKKNIKNTYTHFFRQHRNTGMAGKLDPRIWRHFPGRDRLIKLPLVLRRHTGWIALVGGCFLLFIFLLSTAGAFGSVVSQGGNAIVDSTYLGSDEVLKKAEERYVLLENDLQQQINEMETTRPGYDEYLYQVDEIHHDPFALISYLTVKYGDLDDPNTLDLPELFQQQYQLQVWDTVETRIKKDETTGEETSYEWKTLHVQLTNFGIDHVVSHRLSGEDYARFQLYQATKGNRPELFDALPISGSPAMGGASYHAPSEALSDDRFRNMIGEAEKYLGYPYVWGGASPETSFDCSGYVSWVIDHSNNGWSYGRRTAEGLRNLCSFVPPQEAQPGDLVFFQNTYPTAGASHVGIYVGDGMMIHCGNPIQYTSIRSSYWTQHFLSYGRLP